MQLFYSTLQLWILHRPSCDLRDAKRVRCDLWLHKLICHRTAAFLSLALCLGSRRSQASFQHWKIYTVIFFFSPTFFWDIHWEKKKKPDCELLIVSEKWHETPDWTLGDFSWKTRWISSKNEKSSPNPSLWKVEWSLVIQKTSQQNRM